MYGLAVLAGLGEIDMLVSAVALSRYSNDLPMPSLVCSGWHVVFKFSCLTSATLGHIDQRVNVLHAKRATK